MLLSWFPNPHVWHYSPHPQRIFHLGNIKFSQSHSLRLYLGGKYIWPIFSFFFGGFDSNHNEFKAGWCFCRIWIFLRHISFSLAVNDPVTACTFTADRCTLMCNTYECDHLFDNLHTAISVCYSWKIQLIFSCDFKSEYEIVFWYPFICRKLA